MTPAWHSMELTPTCTRKDLSSFLSETEVTDKPLPQNWKGDHGSQLTRIWEVWKLPARLGSSMFQNTKPHLQNIRSFNAPCSKMGMRLAINNTFEETHASLVNDVNEKII